METTELGVTNELMSSTVVNLDTTVEKSIDSIATAKSINRQRRDGHQHNGVSYLHLNRAKDMIMLVTIN